MNWRTLALLAIAANCIYWAWNAWIELPDAKIVDQRMSADVPVLKIYPEVKETASDTLTSEIDTNPDDTQNNSQSSQSESSQQEASASAATDSQEAQANLEPASSDNVVTDNEQSANSQVNSERDTDTNVQDEPASEATLVAQVDKPVEIQCHRIGFFLSEKEANTAAAWLETEGFPSELVSGEENVWMGYWVYLPAYPNRAAAIQVIEALKEKRIKDLFLETRQPNVNAVSLGLYRQRNGAESRLKQIQTQGYPAKIGNRERAQNVFWLELSLAADKQVPIASIPVETGQVRRLERRDCT